MQDTSQPEAQFLATPHILGAILALSDFATVLQARQSCKSLRWVTTTQLVRTLRTINGHLPPRLWQHFRMAVRLVIHEVLSSQAEQQRREEVIRNVLQVR
jgi:hypothetical protein